MSLAAYHAHQRLPLDNIVLTVTASGTLDVPNDTAHTGARYHISMAASGRYVQLPAASETGRVGLITIVNLSAYSVEVRNADGSVLGSLGATGATSAWLEVGFGGLNWSPVRWSGWTAA